MFNVYTDLNAKIKLTSKNVKNFFEKTIYSINPRNNIFDGYVGFLNYELLCQLINVKIPKQQSNGFHQSIFYKPETLIKIRKNIQILSTIKNYKENNKLTPSRKKFFHEKKFKVNLTLAQYTKLFRNFSQKIREGKTYQIKICQKYRNHSNIDAVKFFWKLMKANSSPESFMIRDNNYSIIKKKISSNDVSSLIINKSPHNFFDCNLTLEILTVD